MKQKVNYIIHHKEAFLKLMEEDVTAIDISIYNTLFLLWNNAEFDDKLSINRNEIMMMSKVGNANTYTKSLRKLDELGFIKYFPSNNPMRGSIITMCRFDNSSDNSTEHSSGNTCDYSSDNSTEHSGDTLYKPYKLYKPINSINNKNKDSSLSENSEKHNSLKTQEEEKEKSSAKKEKELEGVKNFLVENGADYADVSEWFRKRIDERKATTRYYAEKFILECKKNNISVKEGVFACAFNGWVNFNPQWVLNQKESNSKSLKNGKSESPSPNKAGRVNVEKAGEFLERRRKERELQSAQRT